MLLIYQGLQNSDILILFLFINWNGFGKRHVPSSTQFIQERQDKYLIISLYLLIFEMNCFPIMSGDSWAVNIKKESPIQRPGERLFQVGETGSIEALRKEWVALSLRNTKTSNGHITFTPSDVVDSVFLSSKIHTLKSYPPMWCY